MRITTRQWGRPERLHPIWCDVARCNSPYAGLLGEHRSEPLRRQVHGVGPIVATLTQRPGNAVRVELTLSAAVPTARGVQVRTFVEQLVDELIHTVTRAAVIARAESALTDTRAPRAVTK